MGSMQAYTKAMSASVTDNRSQNACETAECSPTRLPCPCWMENSAPAPMLNPRKMEVRNVISV